MTATPSKRPLPASSALPRVGAGEASTRDFALRLGALLLALLLVPWLISVVDPPGVLRYAIPASAALIVAAAYVWRPAEALFALALYVVFYETIAWYIGAPIKRVDELSILVLAPIALWRGLPAWRGWVWWPRDISVAVALVAGVASSLAAGVPLDIWVPALLLVSKAVVFFYIVLVSQVSGAEARAATWFVIGVGFAVSALGFVELFDPGAFQGFLGLNEYVRTRSELVVVKSVFVHPALFGFFTTFVALLLLARYVVTRQMRWLLASLVISTGPFLSARRRAILALGAGVLAAVIASLRFIRTWPRFLRTWVPAAVGGVVLVVLFMSLLSGLYELTSERYGIDIPGVTSSPVPVQPGVEPPVAEAENPRARFALYRGSVEIARDHFPLGGGLGRFGSWMSRVEYSPLYEEYGLSTIRGLRERNPSAATDTFWPQILGELGAVGFVAYAGFILSLGWVLWREAGRDDGPELRILRLGAGMVFAQALVESAASSMFHSPSRVYLLFLIVGIVASLAWRRPREAGR